MRGRLERMKLFYILLKVLPVIKYVFANRAFPVEGCFVIEWSVQRPSLFLGVFWEEIWGEGIWKCLCKQVDSLLREGETEAAHTCFSPLPATRNAGEPCGPEMEMGDLSSLEHWRWNSWVGYDRVRLSPEKGHRLTLGVLNGLYSPVAHYSPNFGYTGKATMGTLQCILELLQGCRVNKSARFDDTEYCVGITGSSPVEPAYFTPNRTTFF